MTTRKTITLAATVLVGLGAAWAWAAASDTEPKDTSEIGQLRKQIADLEKRVERLEKQRANGPITGRPFGFNSPAPRHYWGRGEINGVPYYLIPLGQGSAVEADPNGPGLRDRGQPGPVPSFTR
jgi:hypothetical protein